MLTLNPYLSFCGHSEEALNVYQQVFGSDGLSIMRYGDPPDNQPPGPPMDHKLVMHGVSRSGHGGVTMPFADRVWGDSFGMVTDRFWDQLDGPRRRQRDGQP